MLYFNVRVQMIPKYRLAEWHAVPIVLTWMIYFASMVILIEWCPSCLLTSAILWPAYILNVAYVCLAFTTALLRPPDRSSPIKTLYLSDTFSASVLISIRCPDSLKFFLTRSSRPDMICLKKSPSPSIRWSAASLSPRLRLARTADHAPYYLNLARVGGFHMQGT